MFSAKTSNQVESPASDDDASASVPASKTPHPVSTLSTGSNPAFQGLKPRTTRASSPSTDSSLDRMPDDALRQLSLSPAAVRPTEIESNFPPSRAEVNAGGNLERAPHASLDTLPTELVLKMGLDPRQMQFVSHRYADIYGAQARAISLTNSPSRASRLEHVSRGLGQLQTFVPPHLRHGPLAVLCRRLTFVPPQQRMSTFNLLFAATKTCISPSEPLIELCKQLAAVPPLQRMDTVKRLSETAQKCVSPSEPLTELCKQFTMVPQHQRMDTFDVLFAATKECASPFEPLTELFRQTNAMGEPDRGTCQARLMSLEGAEGARAGAKADGVLGYEHVPDFVLSITGLTRPDQSAALGVLANQLFSRHYLQSHDFAKICENYHHLPWPPAAAAGLLGRIGWISPVARETLSAISLEA